MVKNLTLGITIIGWLLNIGSYYYGKRSERQQKKQELILKYYPNLIENLRLSIPNSYNQFFQGFTGEFVSFFGELLSMEREGTLKIIESLDKELYDDLRIIIDEIIPTLEKIQEKRREIWNSIPRKWFDWIQETDEDLPSIDSQKFLQQTKNSIIWELWRGNTLQARRNFNNVCHNQISWNENTPKRRYAMFEAFKRISENEWESLKLKFESVNDHLKELFDKDILPRMEETLFKLGE